MAQFPGGTEERRTHDIGTTVTPTLKQAVVDATEEHDISQAEIARQGVIAWLVEFTGAEWEEFY